MLIWSIPLEAVLNSPAWPWAFHHPCAGPVVADVCCREACHIAHWQRACFQGCEEAGRLGRKSGLFLFSCAGVIARKGDPGHCPHRRQLSLLAEKYRLSYPPHLPFPGEAQGNTIKSSTTPFYIENALEFEL